jgi:hypothetical protein
MVGAIIFMTMWAMSICGAQMTVGGAPVDHFLENSWTDLLYNQKRKLQYCEMIVFE